MSKSLVDSYWSIDKNSTGEFKDRGSKFIAFAYLMEDESELDEILASLKSDHPKSRHFCYAYRLGLDDNKFRLNDDGEPAGTAGKPIFGQLLSHNITNVAIVVIRYFGGAKLGISGLINAYKEASKLAIENTNIVEKYIFNKFELRFDYEHMGAILNILKDLDLEILDKIFHTTCSVNIQIRLSQSEKIIKEFKARLLNKSIEEIVDDLEIDFCKIIQHPS